MTSPPSDRCCYRFPENPDKGGLTNQSCCWRKTASETTDRCIWHVDPDIVSKSAKQLQDARASKEVRERNSPVNELLDGANLSGIDLDDSISLKNVQMRESDLSGASLRGADFSSANLTRADLSGADLSGADLIRADLSDARLRNASLSGANLINADLTDAIIVESNLSEAELYNANLSKAFVYKSDLSSVNLLRATLSEAELLRVDLSDATLAGANLSGASLAMTDLSGALLSSAILQDVALMSTSLSEVSLSRWTEIRNIKDAIARELTDSSQTNFYDMVARANHELKEAYSDNGLTGLARTARVRERKARRREALAEAREREAWDKKAKGVSVWFWSALSQAITGYGIQIRWIGFTMLLLYSISTFVYWGFTDMTLGASAYYSVVTFVTSPPMPPPSGIPTIIAGIETFVGTVAIVFLGYVLGARERV